MVAATENRGLTPDELLRLQHLLSPLMGALHGQGGGSEVLTIHHPDGKTSTIVAARLRRIRQAAWPMSPELAALSDPYRATTPGREAARRALRAAQYPENGQ